MAVELVSTVLLGDLLLPQADVRAGQAKLPRPHLPADKATPRERLLPPLKSLSDAVAPSQMVVECGGDGQCGPNVLSFLLGLLRLYAGDGAQLRREIVGYVRDGHVLHTKTLFTWRARPNEYLTCQDLMLENMKRWPVSVLQGREPSVELWCSITEELHAWTDLTFLQLCSSRFGVAVQLIGVDDVGRVDEMMRLMPTEGGEPRALIFVGCWYAQHFIAIVDVDDPPSRSNAGVTETTRLVPRELRDGGSDGSEDSSTQNPLSQVAASQTPHNAVAEPSEPTETVQLRDCLGACVVMLYVTILVRPLVYAHLNGVTTLGAMLPSRNPKQFAMAWARRCCRVCWSARTIPFLVGASAAGMRLYAAPIAHAPETRTICNSPEQRRGWLQRGVRFAWCTLSALQGTPIAAAAAQVVTATAAFIRPPGEMAEVIRLGLTDEPGEFRIGRQTARSVLRRPLLDASRGPPAWKALAKIVEQDMTLADLLWEASKEDERLQGWSERIVPPPLDEIPPELLERLPSFEDERLHTVPFPEEALPYRLPWARLPPSQQPPATSTPPCPRPQQMFSADARERLTKWLQAQQYDLIQINQSLSRGVPAEKIERSHRPAAIAIGQSELEPWARRIVWDCRQSCCHPLQYDVPFSTNLNLDLIERELGCYPDQQLLSFALEGARLQADVELQTILVPHLASLPLGFKSVDAEIRRLEGLSWYEFFDDLPFVPVYVNGQGAVARKLEPDRFRRSTEGGGPRKPTFDRGGVQALSINEAAKILHEPHHWQEDQRPDMQEWIAEQREQNGPNRASAPWRAPRCDLRQSPDRSTAPLQQQHTKWPKERKPSVTSLLVALTVLCAAATFLEQPIYIFSDDAKDYFNQMGMATSELWKMGIVFLDNLDSLAADARLIFISENA